MLKDKLENLIQKTKEKLSKEIEQILTEHRQNRKTFSETFFKIQQAIYNKTLNYKDYSEEDYKSVSKFNSEINVLEEVAKDLYFEDCWQAIDGISREKERKIFEVCFAISYRENHSGGLSEVFNVLYDYQELAEKIVEIIKE